MIVYKAVNKINGKIYIGATIRSLEKRMAHHLNIKKKPHFSLALQKYGIQSFDISAIDTASSKEVLDSKEKFWIHQYASRGPQGYNLTAGGEGSNGYKHTQESCRKMSLSQTGEKHRLWGKHHNEEIRKKMSMAKIGKKRPDITGGKNPMFGKKRLDVAARNKLYTGEKHPMFGKPSPKGMLGKHTSEETRRKMSEVRLGKHPTEETRAKMSSAQKGKLRSEEWRKNMGIAQTGRKHSEETKAKISLAHTGNKNPNWGKHLTEETRRKMSESHMRQKSAFVDPIINWIIGEKQRCA